jgi:hypothetical protein
MKKLKGVKGLVKLLNVKASNNPRCKIWKLGSYSSIETECGMLDRKLANITIGILVNPLNAIKTNGYDTWGFCVGLAKMDIPGVIEKLSNNLLAVINNGKL